MFKIRVELQNTSALKIIQDLGIRVHADEKLYQVQQRFIHVRLINVTTFGSHSTYGTSALSYDSAWLPML